MRGSGEEERAGGEGPSGRTPGPGRDWASELGLLAVGAACLAGAVQAWRAKATAPFRLAYFLAWPTFGSAVVLLALPETREMEARLKGRIAADPEVLQRIKAANRHLRGAAPTEIHGAGKGHRAGREA